MNEWMSTKNPPKFPMRVIIYKKETEEEAGYMEFGFWDNGKWFIECGGLGGGRKELRFHEALPTRWMEAPVPPT